MLTPSSFLESQVRLRHSTLIPGGKISSSEDPGAGLDKWSNRRMVKEAEQTR